MDEVFDLPPGQSVRLEKWLPDIWIDEIGIYQARLSYKNLPDLKWAGLPLRPHDAAAMRAVLDSTPCQVDSNTVEFNVVARLHLAYGDGNLIALRSVLERLPEIRVHGVDADKIDQVISELGEIPRFESREWTLDVVHEDKKAELVLRAWNHAIGTDYEFLSVNETLVREIQRHLIPEEH
jgi:hypothetical protein